MSTEEDCLIRLLNLRQFIDGKEAELDELFTHRMDQATRTHIANSLLRALDTYHFEYRSVFAKFSALLAYNVCRISRDVSALVGQYSS